ncbi:MAG: DNA repair protein RadA, partial [Bacteroidales bacterium]|nr:DNA repair protein RadA [Bacteroidales bacterium]
MAKKAEKTMWFCSNCGADSPKWVGKCPACGQWNTMVEEKVSTSSSTTARTQRTSRQKPRAVNDIVA